MHFCSLLLAAALLLPPAISFAQDKPYPKGGFYASLTGTWVVPRDSTLTVPYRRHVASTEIEFDSGFGATAAVGYRFGGEIGFGADFAVELEIGYRSAGFLKFNGHKVSGTTIAYTDDGLPIDGEHFEHHLAGKTPARGRLRALSLMANAFTSFPLWRLRPYVGAGIGAAHLKGAFKGGVTTVGGQIFPAGSKVKVEAWTIAFQAMAGVGVRLTERIEARAGYRLFATADANFQFMKADFAAHNFEAGILYRF